MPAFQGSAVTIFFDQRHKTIQHSNKKVLYHSNSEVKMTQNDIFIVLCWIFQLKIKTIDEFVIFLLS